MQAGLAEFALFAKKSAPSPCVSKTVMHGVCWMDCAVRESKLSLNPRNPQVDETLRGNLTDTLVLPRHYARRYPSSWIGRWYGGSRRESGSFSESRTRRNVRDISSYFAQPCCWFAPERNTPVRSRDQPIPSPHRRGRKGTRLGDHQ